MSGQRSALPSASLPANPTWHVERSIAKLADVAAHHWLYRVVKAANHFCRNVRRRVVGKGGRSAEI
jgi:hypothetical protein